MKIALFISRKNQLSVDCCVEIINLLGADNDISIDQAYKSYFSEDILSKVSFFDSSKKIETNHDFLFSIGGDGTILRSIFKKFFKIIFEDICFKVVGTET